MLPLPPIGAVDRVDIAPSAVGRRPVAADGGFEVSLDAALKSVEKKGQEANAAVAGMLDQTVDVHDAMIALHEAEEGLEITVAIRNKFVQAYQEIMRMQI